MTLGEFLEKEKGDSTPRTRRSDEERQLTPQAKVEVFIYSLLWAFFVLCFTSAPLLAQDFLAKKAVRLGEAVPDFELADTEGKPVRLSHYLGKPVLVHFWSASCPFVARYESRIGELVETYGDQGVAILGIASNVNETPEQIRSVAASRNLGYPVLLDSDQEIADRFGAITTPHVFIIDQKGRLAYEGSFDDQGWSEENRVTQSYARLALDALFSGSAVPHPQTKSFGCTVKRHPA
jgi:peroxiredoxin